MTNDELVYKLREFIKTLRRTPQPISNVISYLVLAADKIEELNKPKIE